MRLLAFGGWGQLGTDLAVAASGRHELVRPRHSEVDVTNETAVVDVVTRVDADAVINMAAFHKVELCEDDPATAFGVNAVGAVKVARAARRAGARYVFISTDYVFGGDQTGGWRESDAVGPLNVYGASKSAGEMGVMAVAPDALIVRGSGMFGHAGSAGKGGNFVDNIIARARSGEKLSVVDDQIFAPTSTKDMAERLLTLLEQSVPPGVYHASNSGSCSWYTLARTALRIVGVDADLTPRATGESPVRRPRYSVLLDTKSAALGLPRSRSWEEALEWYLSAPAAGGQPL